MQQSEAYKILVESIADVFKKNEPFHVNSEQLFEFSQGEILKLISNYLFSLTISDDPIPEYRVICDETNNSDEDIANKRLNVNIEAWGTMSQILKESGIMNE